MPTGGDASPYHDSVRAWLIYITNFFFTAGLGVVFVFLEDVQVANDLADWEIGVVAGTGFGSALVAQLALAPFADRGATTVLGVLAIGAGIAGPIGFAIGETMPVLAFSRGLSGIGLGLFSLLAKKALLGLDATGGGAKLGILLSTAVFGFITGPIIGAALEPLAFVAPFLAVSAALTVVGVPATYTILQAEIAASPVDYSELGRLIRRPKIQAAMLVQVLVLGFIGVFDAIIDRFLTDLGASTGRVALTIALAGAPLLIFPRIAGRLAEERGGAKVMLPALILLIPAIAGYGLVGTVALASICGIVYGTGESFATISAQVLVLEVTGAERAAVGSALLETAGLTAATITAAVTPTVYGAGGSETLFLGSAVVGVVLALLAVARVNAAIDPHTMGGSPVGQTAGP